MTAHILRGTVPQTGNRNGIAVGDGRLDGDGVTVDKGSMRAVPHPIQTDTCLLYTSPFCTGRCQLVLDLANPEVLEYLKKALSDVLANHRISYVKWDMNRHITDAYSSALPADRQPEIYHRYMLNLYALLDYLNKRFPDVAFEGCSGGGGRFDAGMLYYMPQTLSLIHISNPSPYG